MNADSLNIACSNFWMRLCAGGWGCRGKFYDEEMSMCDGTNSFWCEHGGSCEEIVQGEKYSCKYFTIHYFVRWKGHKPNGGKTGRTLTTMSKKLNSKRNLTWMAIVLPKCFPPLITVKAGIRSVGLVFPNKSVMCL